MSDLENLTPLAAVCLPSMSRDDRVLTLVVVSGRFELPRPGKPSADEPKLAPEQPPVLLEDEYTGDPASSSLRREGQSAYTRPGTDVYLSGEAWAPDGKPTHRSLVGVRVGALQKGAVVFGERVWGHGLAGPGPSSPAAFTSIPLQYERCFGGSPSSPSKRDAELAEHNPVGRGLYSRERDAIGELLPNFEDPQALLSALSDRPKPCGFGPVARHWRPRRTFGGTYDQAWMDERMPLWPRDFEERYLSAAAPGLLATPHLQGGEPVRIVGMSPDGAYEFSLPRLLLQARFEVGPNSVRQALVLDAVAFETDTGGFTMTWRTSLAADPLTVGAVVLRPVAAWEGELQ